MSCPFFFLLLFKNNLYFWRCCLRCNHSFISSKLCILYWDESGAPAGGFLLEFRDILRPGYEPSAILDSVQFRDYPGQSRAVGTPSGAHQSSVQGFTGAPSQVIERQEWLATCHAPSHSTKCRYIFFSFAIHYRLYFQADLYTPDPQNYCI
jgi:hypothetical protein